MTAIFTTPADATIVAYLTPLATGATVATKVPTTVPTKFVHVVATGGAGRRSTVLDDRTVAIECWANTYADAAALMASMDGHMHNARHVAGSAILNVEAFSAPVELPLADSPKYRLTATYQVTVRAA